MKSINKIIKIWAVAFVLPLALSSVTQAAISITIASPNSTAGLYLDSAGLIVTTGFARVGKLTGTIDPTKIAPTFSNFQYLDSLFVDVNDPTALGGGGGSTPTTWNFSGTGALGASSTGIAGFAQNTQIYLWAFKVSGSSLTAGSAGTSSVTIPSLSSADFANGVQWALVTADEWKAPADLGSLSLLTSQITPTDLIQSPIIGSDLGASVRMIPEPSSASLLALGVAGLVALRVRRKS